jgi:hypothetical protein
MVEWDGHLIVHRRPTSDVASERCTRSLCTSPHRVLSRRLMLLTLCHLHLGATRSYTQPERIKSKLSFQHQKVPLVLYRLYCTEHQAPAHMHSHALARQKHLALPMKIVRYTTSAMAGRPARPPTRQDRPAGRDRREPLEMPCYCSLQ